MATTINKIRQHQSAGHAFAVTVWWAAALLVLGLAVIASVLVADAIARRRLNLVRREWEPSLRRWLDLPVDEALPDSRIEHWMRDRRAGVSPEMAEAWAIHGFTPGIASAALKADADLHKAQALGAIMSSTGAWDGVDRRRLEDLIGWHVDFVDPAYPVLGWWLELPETTLVRTRVARAVDEAAARWDSSPPQSRAGLAAEQVLYELRRATKAAARRAVGEKANPQTGISHTSA